MGSYEGMRTKFVACGAVAALLCVLPSQLLLAAQQPGAPASIVGVAYDSVRGRPMAGAQIGAQGTPLVADAGPDGRFHFDSVPPGQYRLIAAHPILDSIGIQLATPPFTLAAGQKATMNMATPSPAALVKMLCPAAWLTRGPATLFGYVRNADTDQPVTQARVSVVWHEIDFQTLSKVPRLREATTSPDGSYRICGLPSTFDGRVQVDHAGLKSGDVPVAFQNEFLQLRSLSIASATMAVASGDANPPARRVLTVAKLRGRVLGTAGQPVSGARVQLEGTTHSVNTAADGTFSLDSLPHGSQVVRAMLMGFAPVEQPVELSSRLSTTVTLQMEQGVTMLPTVTIRQRQTGLDAVGFTWREKSGHGFFLDEKAIDAKQARLFSDLLATTPGISVSTSGSDTSIRDSRNPIDGCVNFVVDGSPWTSMAPGDIDRFIQGSDIGAIEVYHGGQAPAQFQLAGQSVCAVVVAWTKWRLDRDRNKRP